MGFQQAYAYKTVFEIILEDGKFIEIIDRSKLMEAVRLSKNPKDRSNEVNIVEFIENSFSHSYVDKWNE